MCTHIFTIRSVCRHCISKDLADTVYIYRISQVYTHILSTCVYTHIFNSKSFATLYIQRPYRLVCLYIKFNTCIHVFGAYIDMHGR